MWLDIPNKILTSLFAKMQTTFKFPDWFTTKQVWITEAFQRFYVLWMIWNSAAPTKIEVSRSDSPSPHGFCITFLKGRSFFSDHRCQCQVTPGHSSRWLEWGHYVVVRMIWNLQATAGSEVRAITHPVSVFVFSFSFFFCFPWPGMWSHTRLTFSA